MAAARRARPASAPMTIPAIAPPERLDDLGTGVAVAELEDEGADTEVDDAGVDDAREVADDDDDEDALVELDRAELATLLDSEPPKTCANLTTPTLLVQHWLLLPQHHLSLSARPVHGVICVLPAPPREVSQALIHLLGSLLAQ
jgi:hypothetical protein